MKAADIVERIREAGGAVELSGQWLDLSAPRPLPRELMDLIRQNKADLLAFLAGETETEDQHQTGPLHCFEYRMRGWGDDKQWLTLLTPDTKLEDVRRGLRDRFGRENVLAVRRKISTTMESTL